MARPMQIRPVLLSLCVAATAGPASAAEDWVKEALKALPQHVESVMVPGCLLPETAVLARAPVPRATLYISVDTEGKVASTKVWQSAGEPDVDTAIADAASKCRFEPKYIVTPPSNHRTVQTEFRELRVQWPVPVPRWGPNLCFPPEYPHAIRQAEAQGSVTVVATKPDANAAPELAIVEPLSARSALRQLTLDVVAACFGHPVTHAEMPLQRPFQYRYQWVLQ